MQIDKKLKELPLVKTNPNTLISLFGSSDVTPMWVADMEFEIAKPIQDALMQRISNSGFGYEYKPKSFFIAQQEWYKNKYQINLNKNELIDSPSITTTIALAIENWTSQGDGVIIQPPVFLEFGDIIRKTKRRVINNPLKLVNNHYEIDFEDLEKKAKLQKNKILILCNPHNPVGRVWKKYELEKIISICKKNDLLLISDEIHKDIILFGNKFTSALHYTDKLENMVVCVSEAKTFNLCAIANSTAIITNKDLRNSLLNFFNIYNLNRVNALTRVALEAGYKSGSLWLQELIKYIEDNVKSIEKELKDSKIKLIKPEGTYQVWLDFREVYKHTKEMFSHLCENSKIGMNAGHWFGREGAPFMRMNIATSNEKVIKSIKKVKNAIPDIASSLTD